MSAKSVDNEARRVAAQAAGRHPAPVSEGRSRNMQAIRRADTKIEVALRSQLHRAGYRFRKDYRIEAGGVRVKADIVFTRQRLAVFLDGCFWHGCPEHGKQPKINDWYWGPKLERNRARDAAVNGALAAGGWTVLRFWGHTPLTEAAAAIPAFLTEPQ